MKRVHLRLGWWFFRRFLVVTLIVFGAVAGVFTVVDLAERIGTVDDVFRERGTWEGLRLVASYYVMQLSLEFMRFPDVVLTTAAGLSIYAIIRSGEAVSITGLGVSLRRLALPVMGAMFLLGAGTSIFNECCSHSFTRKYEEIRAFIWKKGTSERVTFTVPGRGLLCSAERVLPDGSVEGLTVIDAGGHLAVYTAREARYGEAGDLRAGGGITAVYPEDAPVRASLDVKSAPLAALRLSRYGAFWVRISDLVRLGDGAAAAAAGKIAGMGFLLAGLGMLACGLVMGTRENPSLATTIIVLLAVEGVVRLMVEGFVNAWTPAGTVPGFAWGLAMPAAVFIVGSVTYARAPS